MTQKVITWRGKTLTLSQWAKQTGIKKGTLWARLNNGWPLERVFDPTDGHSTRTTYDRRDNVILEYEGRSLPLYRWAKITGIPLWTIARRLRDGWTPIKALTVPAVSVGYGGLAVKHKAEHEVWRAMISRCRKPNHRAYGNYGGRGVKVCDRWRKSFADFLTDVGPRPSPQHSIDRYPDNNGDYEPENVRWATRKEQGRNRRNNKLITFRGKTLCIAEWAEHTGLAWGVIASRIEKGWPVKEALTLPATLKKSHVHPRHRINK